MVTTGGTGPAPRDVTPEATEAVRPRAGARVAPSNLAAFCLRPGWTHTCCVRADLLAYASTNRSSDALACVCRCRLLPCKVLRDWTTAEQCVRCDTGVRAHDARVRGADACYQSQVGAACADAAMATVGSVALQLLVPGGAWLALGGHHWRQ